MKKQAKNATLDSVASSVETLTTTVEQLTGTVGTLTNTVGTLTNTVGTLAAGLKTLTSTVGTLAHGVETLTTTVGTLATGLQTLTDTVDNLAASTARGFQEIHVEFGAIRAEAKDMEAKILQKMDGINRRIDDISFRKADVVELKKLDTRVGQLERKTKA